MKTASHKLIIALLAAALLAAIACPLGDVFAAGEVAIYTAETVWISKEAADKQAQICTDKLDAAGIANTRFDSSEDMDALANWMKNATGNGRLDVCILYGGFPSSIYPSGNTLPDGSIAEAFIETTDGDAFINHAEYMFWGGADGNETGGLQNMMDIPTISMWDDDTPMTVTEAGKSIAPSLTNFSSDRPFHVDELAGDWRVEAVLAQNHDGTRADPIIVRDGNRGRLIPIMQTFGDANPHGAVAAEVIDYLMSGKPFPKGSPVATHVTIPVSQAQTHIHVDAVNGINAATGRGPAGKAYKSITYALLISEKSNLPEPWHVHIHPGTYNADPAKPANEREVFPIKLRSKMLIQGTTTANDCIIDGQHLGETDTSILIGEDVGDVSIRNLTIQNMNRKWSDPANAGGIVFWDTGGGREAVSSIEGCIVHNNALNGVGTNLPLVLIGNTFSNNNRNGVWTNTSLTVLNNTFRHNRGTGLMFDAISSNFVGDISDNIFESNEERGRNSVGGGFEVQGNLMGDVTRNKFIGNFADRGSGFWVYNLTGNVSHNTFENNSSEYDGGGFSVRSLSGNVTHNTFKNNNASRGGGFFVESTFKGDVTHNTFVNNTAGWGQGGGFMVLYHEFTGKITHNLFDSNSCGSEGGGAIELPDGGNAEFTNNIFINNTGADTSFGIGSGVHTEAPAVFTNNLFMVSALSAGVSMPAVQLEKDAYAPEDPEWRFHNNIFSGMKTAIHVEASLDLPITYNLFHNIGTNFVNGAGNDLSFWELLADGANNNIAGGLPLVDPANGDFHPVAGSPTIDAGTNQYAPADDFDGVARPIGGTVDIGPYEYNRIPEQTATFAPEDVNQDGRVSIADVIEVAQSLGKPVSQKPRADVNGDGSISFADLVAIARAIAKARSDAAAAPGHKAVVLDAATVQTWLQLARIEDDGSLMFREGIANLEQLLASLLPKETLLLANYPNPFNPETWIPYQLASPAAVTLHIHAVDGTLVRTLLLGHKAVGTYQNRNRAAYWDGKNEVGEPVASGVYFYTLTAGDFTATRKMLIRK